MAKHMSMVPLKTATENLEKAGAPQAKTALGRAAVGRPGGRSGGRSSGRTRAVIRPVIRPVGRPVWRPSGHAVASRAAAHPPDRVGFI